MLGYKKVRWHWVQCDIWIIIWVAQYAGINMLSILNVETCYVKWHFSLHSYIWLGSTV